MLSKTGCLWGGRKHFSGKGSCFDFSIVIKLLLKRKKIPDYYLETKNQSIQKKQDNIFLIWLRGHWEPENAAWCVEFGVPVVKVSGMRSFSNLSRVSHNVVQGPALTEAPRDLQTVS